MTATIAVLEAVLAAITSALMTKEPLPVRLVGFTLETVSHDALQVGVSHVILDSTDMVILPPADGAVHEVADIENITGACITAIVRLSPPPVIVTVASLDTEPSL